LEYAWQSTFHVDEIATQSQLAVGLNAAAFVLDEPEDFMHAESCGLVDSVEATLHSLRAQAAGSSYAL